MMMFALNLITFVRSDAAAGKDMQNSSFLTHNPSFKTKKFIILNQMAFPPGQVRRDNRAGGKKKRQKHSILNHFNSILLGTVLWVLFAIFAKNMTLFPSRNGGFDANVMTPFLHQTAGGRDLFCVQ